MNVQTSQQQNKVGTSKSGIISRYLDKIEQLGNKLPDVITLFLLIILFVLITSKIAASLGLTAVNPVTKETIKAVDLLSKDGIIRILTEMVTNFTSFPPLGLVLVVMLGAGLAESTGLLEAVMKKIVFNAPQKWILPIIVFVCMLGHAAADAAFIVMPPIAALIFLMVGRNPLVGLAAAYAAVAGGFSANIIVSVLDVTLASFTEPAAQIIDKDYIGNPTMNYYFMVASTIMLIPVTTIVTTKIVEPRLGNYNGNFMLPDKKEIVITPEEKRGLKWAGIALLACIAILLILTIPENALLRDPKTGSLIVSPFMKSLVPIILSLFLFPALAYGIGAKVIRSDKDVASHLTKSMSGMGYYIVLAFVAAQMIAYFSWSNLGPIVAIKGAKLLESSGLDGLALLIIFIIFVALIDFLIASSTAKWAILAPVFVPMFLLLDYSPAFTQVAYRIGDSIINTITPMLPYFAILLTFAKKYDNNIQVGTLITILIPYTIAFGFFWILLFAIWYLLGLPLGPGVFINA
jgi:aminobenzoyl-glutamate transport protein